MTEQLYPPVHHWVIVEESLGPRYALPRRELLLWPPLLQIPGAPAAEHQGEEEDEQDNRYQVLATHVVHQSADVYTSMFTKYNFSPERFGNVTYDMTRNGKFETVLAGIFQVRGQDCSWLTPYLLGFLRRSVHCVDATSTAKFSVTLHKNEVHGIHSRSSASVARMGGRVINKEMRRAS